MHRDSLEQPRRASAYDADGQPVRARTPHKPFFPSSPKHTTTTTTPRHCDSPVINLTPKRTPSSVLQQGARRRPLADHPQPNAQIQPPIHIQTHETQDAMLSPPLTETHVEGIFSATPRRVQCDSDEQPQDGIVEPNVESGHVVLAIVRAPTSVRSKLGCAVKNVATPVRRSGRIAATNDIRPCNAELLMDVGFKYTPNPAVQKSVDKSGTERMS